jgi:hypothetical protein
MTDTPNLRAIVDRLEALRTEATPTPWAYKPQEMDDWGFIRGPADERGLRWVVARSHAGHRSPFYDAGYHRANGTDPFEPNGRFIVEAVNALPELLSAITALQARVVELEGRIAAAKSVIETGGDRETGRSGMGRCPHNRLPYEDCIGCYDEDLIEALEGKARSLSSREG